jgi:hypothetical protein
MARRLRTGVLVAIAATATTTLAGQDPSTAEPSGTVTVVGCVQRIDESGSLDTTIPERTPTPEQVGVAANSGEPAAGFMLTDATPASTHKTPSERKDSPAATRDLPRVRYVMIGKEEELARYLGQRVRVQGTLPAAPTKPAETTPVGTSGSTQIQSNTARLKVAAIERMAPDCK